jgi:hypothetical protein
VTENIVAGLNTSVAIWLAVWAFWSALAWPWRRRLQRFFGIAGPVTAIGLYLSLLRVERAAGAEAVRVGFTGAGLIRSEYIAACSLRDSLLDIAVSHVRRLRWRLDMTIDASPRTPLSEPLHHPDQALILLGTKVHNALTEPYFDANGNSHFIWTRNAMGQLEAGEADNGGHDDVELRSSPRWIRITFE